MIKFTNKDLNSGTIDSLNQLLSMDISPTNASALLEISQHLKGIIDNKNLIYNKILTKHGNPEPDGSVLVSNEKMPAYHSDMNELLSISHNIDVDTLVYEEMGLELIKTIDLDNVKFIFGIDSIGVEMSESELALLEKLG